MMRHSVLAILVAAALASACSDDFISETQQELHFANLVTYSGQGLLADGFGGYDLVTEICGVANGADVDGPYLLWVLTATGAKNADISFYGAEAVAMTKTGNGTFKYVSPWLDPSTLPGNVSASYDLKAKNAQLTISHGCRPFTHGAWCSPGFWRNAKDSAWALTGLTRSDLFNATVYDFWYGATFAADPTLATVLGNPPTYSGPPNAGTSGYPLNAFNATGAMLTDRLPGYSFDFDLIAVEGQDQSDTCPIDHFGNWKDPQ